jgi:acetolactate synthase-1/2/3 large subunit
VEKREELKDSIAEMINFKGAFILEVIVMDEENVMPMIPPGNSVDNMIFSLAGN